MELAGFAGCLSDQNPFRIESTKTERERVHHQQRMDTQNTNSTVAVAIRFFVFSCGNVDYIRARIQYRKTLELWLPHVCHIGICSQSWIIIIEVDRFMSLHSTINQPITTCFHIPSENGQTLPTLLYTSRSTLTISTSPTTNIPTYLLLLFPQQSSLETSIMASPLAACRSPSTAWRESGLKRRATPSHCPKSELQGKSGRKIRI